MVVLVLNADFTPLRVISWQRAIGMLVEAKATLVEPYAARVVRSARASLPLPAVVVLTRYSRFRGRVRFNRRNVLARDGFSCQYCGVRPLKVSGRPDLSELTLDHIVPRAQSVDGRVTSADGRRMPVTCWENVTTACASCNGRKAARTPKEAKMTLRSQPRVPRGWDLVWMAVSSMAVPEEWKEYLPSNSPWRAYWTAELDPS